MVLSHCCMVALDRNGIAQGRVAVVSPLVPIPSTYLEPEHVTMFKENNPAEYQNSFYLPPSGPLPSELMVDLGRVTSVLLRPRGQYQVLLIRKVLQLADEERIKLKTKLALCYGEETKEELALGFSLEKALGASNNASQEPPQEAPIK